jgi:hypothetical protein
VDGVENVEMERQAVTSSSIASVGYDAPSSVLEVEFLNGRLYQYLDVPQRVFEEFVEAESVGSYLNRHVKGSYQYLRLDDGSGE